MKFLVQFMLSFYSLRTLRFKRTCPGTFQKEHISLSVILMVLPIKLKLRKCVIWTFCVRIVENMNVFSVANMCLLFAMSICK